MSAGKFECILAPRFRCHSGMLLYKWRVIFNGVRYLPKGIFPKATFQVRISQEATSQMCNFPSGNFPKVRLGPLRRSRLQWGRPSAATGEVAAWEITHLGSCHLGKILWESIYTLKTVIQYFTNHQFSQSLLIFYKFISKCTLAFFD